MLQSPKQIGFIELCALLFRKLWIILLCAVLGGAVTFGGAYCFVPEKFQAKVELYVNTTDTSADGKPVSITGADISTARSLVSSYIVILKSIPTMKAVAEESGLDYTYMQLTGMVSASTVNNTEIFDVFVTCSDPYEAQILANTVAEVLPGRIAKIIHGSDVEVLQYAELPLTRHSPNYAKYTLLGCIVSALIAIAVILLVFYIDDSIRSEDMLKQYYPEFPLLVSIPDDTLDRGRYGRYYRRGYTGSDTRPPSAKGSAALNGKHKRGRDVSARHAEEHSESGLIGAQMSFIVSEAYKLLRSSLGFAFAGKQKCHIVGVTSAFHSEGKSVVSINMAYTIAEAGRRVLLIDADMRLSLMARRLGLKTKPGLSDVLADMESDIIQRYSAETDRGKEVSFDVIIAGSIPPNPSELLGSERMKRLLDKMREHYDYVILDLPPVAEVADALAVAEVIDGVVIIARRKVATRSAVSETIRKLQLVNEHIAGIVYNCADEYAEGRKYYYWKRFKRYDRSYSRYAR